MGCFHRTTPISLLLILETGVLVFVSSAKSAGRTRQTPVPQQQSSQSSQSSETPAAKAQAYTSASSQASPQTKSRKVWTNEDLVLLRTPAANYQLEKEAREAAETEAAAKAAAVGAADEKAGKEAELAGVHLPSTAEETRALIKGKQQQIDDEQGGSARLLNDLANAPDSQAESVQKEIDRIAADIPKLRLQIKLLQEHLTRLSGARAKAAPEPSPSRSTSTNP